MFSYYHIKNKHSIKTNVKENILNNTADDNNAN